MEMLETVVLAICIVILLFLTIKLYFDEHKSRHYRIGTKFIVRVAIFGAISAILYITIKFPVPFCPTFMELHFDEVPAFIAGFAYGPLAGVCVLLIKTIIKLPFTSTLGVGELCDLICSVAFIVPASLIYKYKRNFKGAFLGIFVGTLFQIGAALLSNIYLIIPFYMKVMEFSPEAILSLCQKVNPNITDLGWTYGLFAVIPFNAFKDGIIIVITLLVYKTIHRFIDRLQN